MEAVNELLRERGLNYALAVEPSGRVATLIVVTTPPPAATKDRGRSTREPIASLLDVLERAGVPPDESAPSATGAEEVLPTELAEHVSAATAKSPAKIPEGSPLRLLIPSSAPARKPTGESAPPQK